MKKALEETDTLLATKLNSSVESEQELSQTLIESEYEQNGKRKFVISSELFL